MKRSLVGAVADLKVLASREGLLNPDPEKRTTLKQVLEMCPLESLDMSDNGICGLNADGDGACALRLAQLFQQGSLVNAIGGMLLICAFGIWCAASIAGAGMDLAHAVITCCGAAMIALTLSRNLQFEPTMGTCKVMRHEELERRGSARGWWRGSPLSCWCCSPRLSHRSCCCSPEPSRSASASGCSRSAR